MATAAPTIAAQNPPPAEPAAIGLSDSDDDNNSGRKRKRKNNNSSSSSSSKWKMIMAMLKVVMQRQESLLLKFLEAIEKQERARAVRDESILSFLQNAARERAIIISLLQKLTMPPSPPPPTAAIPSASRAPAPEPPVSAPATKLKSTPMSSLGPQGPKWLSLEVDALIRLRSEFESRSPKEYRVWKQISAGMRRLGFDRSATCCRSKWHNITSYFKRMKGSEKCPYFRQLDAYYRGKLAVGNGGSDEIILALSAQRQQVHETRPNQDLNLSPLSMMAMVALSESSQPCHEKMEDDKAQCSWIHVQKQKNAGNSGQQDGPSCEQQRTHDDLEQSSQWSELLLHAEACRAEQYD